MTCKEATQTTSSPKGTQDSTGCLRPIAWHDTGHGHPADVDLVVVDPEPSAVLVSDEVLLTQVLRNLLHNGLKFTEHGEVRMTADHDGDLWTFRVSDTGVGIAPELQERIFEEFYQVPGRSTGGTGLGLPYARRLATLLGGTLEVESRPGVGTTFTVQLPVRPTS